MLKKTNSIPFICKNCPNAKYFSDGGVCNLYWEGKTYCPTKYWLNKVGWN